MAFNAFLLAKLWVKLITINYLINISFSKVDNGIILFWKLYESILDVKHLKIIDVNVLSTSTFLKQSCFINLTIVLS
jgi:hypothetical protein